jgi:hypothetical protein
VRRFLNPATAESIRRSIAALYGVRYVIAQSPRARPSAVVQALAADGAFRRVGMLREGRTVYTVFERR